MKKILYSAGIIVFVVAVALGATGAFFSDTETSTGNTFTAGAIDLKIDSTQHFNNAKCVNNVWVLEGVATVPEFPVIGSACGGTWELKDLLPTGSAFFNFTDVKPGDSGENTISLHVDNNPAWACVNIIPTKNDDVTSTEPELEVVGETANTDSIYDGELAQNMQFTIWADICAQNVTGGGTFPNAVVGDNIYQPQCDILLTQGPGPIIPTAYAIATPALNVFNGLANSPLNGTQTYYLGAGWSIPTTTGNIIQTDTYMADISFYVEQSRNNPNFVCPPPPNQPAGNHSLRLENETEVVGGPWTVHSADQIYADLTWTGDGTTFNYTLNGKGLAATTNYSLIYYADGWPGNNPGAFIGSGTTDAGGNLVMAGNPDLNTDLPELPDGNFAVGAKIWLVRTSDYNNGLLSTGPMTAWNPANYLFEGNVYIHYDDTNHP